jgi:hypothetical protein
MSLLGSSKFVSRFYEGAKGRKKLPLPEMEAVDFPPPAISIDKQFKRIVHIVAKDFDVQRQDILKPRSRHPGRKYVVELAMRYAIDSRGVKFLGERLGVTGSALAHLRRSFEKQLAEDPEILTTFQRLEHEFLKD